jgi:hypothetical protein
MQLMNNHIYQERRNALAKHIFSKTGSGLAVISTAPELTRNRDSEYPYRYDSDFFYLTGFEEPGATLVLQVQKNGKGFELHHKRINSKNNYKITLDLLKEVLLLSKCNQLINNVSNIPFAISYINPEIEIITL